MSFPFTVDGHLQGDRDRDECPDCLAILEPVDFDVSQVPEDWECPECLAKASDWQKDELKTSP